MGCITASKVENILKITKTTKEIQLNKIVYDIMGYEVESMKEPPAPKALSLKWGIYKEKNARSEYENVLKNEGHVDVSIELCGLVVDKTNVFLRASPDGIINCKCHGRRLLEIKCPYSCRSIDPNEGIAKKVIDYINKGPNGELTLDKNKRGYYAQVTTSMAICKLSKCDFVVWSPHGLLSIPINFDPEYWNVCLEKTKNLFDSYIVGEILTREKKFLDIRKDECTSHTDIANTLEKDDDI